MKKTALITGVCGQDGSYLAELLVRKGYLVVGLDRKKESELPSYLKALKTKLNFVSGEMSEEDIFSTLVKKFQPDEIYNLGAISSIKAAWENPVLTSVVNALAPERIYESVRQFKPTCRVFQASSSEIFGRSSVSPQNEQTPLNPSNPYGFAKAYAQEMAKMYRDKFKMFICCGILYNHESPRRPLNFVTSKIAYGAACAKLGIQNSNDLNEEGEPIVKNGKIALGNLDAQRDWSSAEDFVEGMYLMLQQDEADDYVLGSGKLHTISDFCQAAFSFVGLDYKDCVVVDPRFVRPVEPVPMVANASKTMSKLNWKAKITFSQLVQSLVEENLKKLSSLR